MPRDSKEEREQEFTPSTSELDMDRRMREEQGDESPADEPGRDFSGGRDEDEVQDFVGVDPVYRNYGNEVDQPLPADDDTAVGYFEAKHAEASDMIVSGAEDRVAETTVHPGVDTSGVVAPEEGSKESTSTTTTATDVTEAPVPTAPAKPTSRSTTTKKS